MSATVSTALTIAANSTLREFERAIKNPFLKSLFHGIVISALLDYQNNPTDIIPHLRFGQTTYSFNPQTATALFTGFIKLGQVIQCAALDFNPYATNTPLPITIPHDKFISIAMPAPLISLALAAPHRNPLLAEYSSIKEVFHNIRTLQHAYHYYIQWTARAITKSIEQGLGSKWNFGAYFGIPQEEFLLHVRSRPLPIKPLTSLRYDGHAVDNSMAMILHPTHSSVAIRAANIYEGRIPTDDGLPIVAGKNEDNIHFYSDFLHLFI
ncbi:hypothetical protein DXG01_002498 [Tephrocybe rancida]|nr:hypothetical protein DXG01_002498 [Tephrocybe rancida]